MFVDELCGFCATNPSSRRGEHVWPQWYLRDLDAAGAPPLGWVENGVPVVDRAGQPLQRSTRARVFFPACEPCNARLNTNIEVPAKRALRRLLPAQWTGIATADEWRAIGIWFAKAMLLGHHSSAQFSIPQARGIRRAFTQFPPDVTWLVSDPFVVPDEVSVWVHRTSLEDEQTYHRDLIVPGRTEDRAGVHGPTQHLVLGSAGLGVNLLIHPGWRIENSMVVIGEAVDVIRGRKSFDVSKMPFVSTTGLHWKMVDVVLATDFVIGRQLRWYATSWSDLRITARPDLAAVDGLPLAGEAITPREHSIDLRESC